MAEEAQTTCYDSSWVKRFHYFLQQSGEHKTILSALLLNILPGEFKRMGLDKSSLDVLGLGSGGGDVEVQTIALLQSTFPDVPITTDIVEGSIELTNNFKALIAKNTNLQKIPFAWHLMSSEDYEKQVKAQGDLKKYDFIQMVQMIYYVDNLGDTITFYHSLLKNNGRLMIVVISSHCGWDTLWKTYEKEFSKDGVTKWRPSAVVIAYLKSQGLKYEEHVIPNDIDITECFDPSSENGVLLLEFITGNLNFYQSLTPEIRAGILDLLRSKCSTEKDGKVIFNTMISCILVYA
ncbi:histamine N-methyltransferase A-like [Clinocottus analis]|uniref:histamine N-methyltransferase A-like n=1 Tax=Clinocottus analis TaxID=304258 RepID=UPI0035C20395